MFYQQRADCFNLFMLLVFLQGVRMLVINYKYYKQCGFVGETSNKWVFKQGSLYWWCFDSWHEAFQGCFTPWQCSCLCFLQARVAATICMLRMSPLLVGSWLGSLKVQTPTEKMGCMGTDTSLLCSVFFHIFEKTLIQLQLCFQHSRICTLHKNCWRYAFTLTSHGV